MEEIREIILGGSPHHLVEIPKAKISAANNRLQFDIFVCVFFIGKYCLILSGELKAVSEKLAHHLKQRYVFRKKGKLGLTQCQYSRPVFISISNPLIDICPQLRRNMINSN